ncbi:hypothetical protein H6P81_011995 [Aristolochia fimbriata]|uniref:Thylakoid lumenal 17.9 kDa protein, chloroplastic n=1 Tax=Aristolochia fimbriata TaxID=158543 RepID=A0AAV7EAH7_ARIFI|nr:hypothetical protein H6P81_011995 [Aristolochia fimbriata]
MPRALSLCSLQSSGLSKISSPECLFPVRNPDLRGIFSSGVVSVAIALAVTSAAPSLAIPSLSSPSLSPTTPFSQSQNLQIGLENGKIRPCPSTNPGCISTNPKSSSFSFPWEIPESDSDSAVQKLKEAIFKTQTNVKIQAFEDTPNGQYLQAEVDGSFGRDVLEFLVKKDVVSYRCMATKVTYVYPFTTAIGDSRGQKERLKRIVEQLRWIEPDFEYMD